MHLSVYDDGFRTFLKVWLLMDFNFQREVEMLRRMVNGLPFGHANYFHQFFPQTYYGFQSFFEDPVFEQFFAERNGRQRTNNSRHSRNLARSLVLLENLLTNQVNQRQGEIHNNRHRSRINITLQPRVIEITPQHNRRESPASNDTNSVCECVENGSSDIEICTICREKFKEKDNIRQLPCEHLFHPDCLRPWLQRRNTCPTCRQRL